MIREGNVFKKYFLLLQVPLLILANLLFVGTPTMVSAQACNVDEAGLQSKISTLTNLQPVAADSLGKTQQGGITNTSNDQITKYYNDKQADLLEIRKSLDTYTESIKQYAKNRCTPAQAFTTHTATLKTYIQGYNSLIGKQIFSDASSTPLQGDTYPVLELDYASLVGKTGTDCNTILNRISTTLQGGDTPLQQAEGAATSNFQVALPEMTQARADLVTAKAALDKANADLTSAKTAGCDKSAKDLYEAKRQEIIAFSTRYNNAQTKIGDKEQSDNAKLNGKINDFFTCDACKKNEDSDSNTSTTIQALCCLLASFTSALGDILKRVGEFLRTYINL